MANIATFTRDVYPGLTKVIFNDFKRQAKVYPSCLRMESTDRWYEEHNTEAGYGLFAQTGEGEKYAQDDMYPGYYTKIQLNKYTKYFRVSEDLMEFGMYVKMNERASAMGTSASITQEVLGALPWNTSFTTNQADGVPIFSTSHPGYPGSGQLFSNVLTTQASLSFVSFNDVITNIMTQTDERGMLIYLIPRKLVVHPANQLVALEILKSVGRPDTANRVDNMLGQRIPQIDLVINPFLTSSSMWFVLCDKFHVYGYEHGGFKTRPKEDPFNGDALVFGKFYFSTGASHFLGTYAGSQ